VHALRCGLDEHGDWRKRYGYSFRTCDLEEPPQHATADAGWTGHGATSKGARAYSGRVVSAAAACYCPAPHAGEWREGMVRMAAGFEVRPEELRGAARAIGEALGNAAGIAWGPPSGDYGHAGVQAAFASFVEDAERRVGELGAGAERLGRGLGESASAYEESDSAAARRLMRAVEDLFAQPAPGGGADGPFPGGTYVPRATIPPNKASRIWQRLNPDASDAPGPTEEFHEPDTSEEVRRYWTPERRAEAKPQRIEVRPGEGE
jgi:hypothetical protein